MALLPKISESEWIVMKVFWKAQRALTTGEVVQQLEGKTRWKPKTIHTLLRRLVEKGALKNEKVGREFSFQPQVTAAECEHALARTFLGSFFNGKLAPFLARFVEKEKLKPSEIEELRRILGRKDP